jgi:hypothetical protein
MNTHADKTQENKSQSVANGKSQMQSSGESTFQFVDNRPEAIAQRKLQEIANNSPQVAQLKAFQEMANGTSSPIQMVRPISNVTGGDAGIIQRVTVDVTNETDEYSSGWLQAETASTGVDAEPQKEAQDVAKIIGGTWVGGHMVNDRLGGLGDFDNIVPITSSMNNQHHTTENAAQKIVGDNGTDSEVQYRMNILTRRNVTAGENEVNNLAVKFQQHYDYRTKEVKAGGTKGRPILAQEAGQITVVDGEVLVMDTD